MKDFTAQEAKASAIAGLDKRLEKAIKEIKWSAERGQYSCLILCDVTDLLVERLKALGYQVEPPRPGSDSCRVIWR
jgi:hypothetical protein